VTVCNVEVKMGLEIPVYVGGSGESVEIEFVFENNYGNGVMQFVYPSFKANVFAEYLVCAEFGTDPTLPLNPQMNYNDSLSMTLMDVSIEPIMSNPSEPATTVEAENSNNWMERFRDNIRSDWLSGDLDDPTPFFTDALVLPMEDILEEWASQYAYFLTNYVWLNNNLLANEQQNGTERIAAITGVDSLWGSSAPGCKSIENGDYAGISFVIVEAEDTYVGIGGNRPIADGKNVSSYQNPAQWVRLDGNELASLDSVSWLRNINNVHADSQNTYESPLSRQIFEDFIHDFLHGLIDLSLNDYHGENFCEDKWASIDAIILDECVNVTWGAYPDATEICEYFISEAEVQFFETCVQPTVIVNDLFCLGLHEKIITGANVVDGSRSWYKMSEDYMDLQSTIGVGCPIGDCNLINGGDFEAVQIDSMALPAPYIEPKSGYGEYDELHIPSWVSVEMELEAMLKGKQVNADYCEDYVPPNEGLYDAYEERLDQLDARINANFPSYEEAPESARDEFERIETWLDENSRISLATARDELEVIEGYLDAAAYDVHLNNGIIELQLAVDWSFPMYEGQSWEWAASNWAGNVVPYDNSYLDYSDLDYAPEAATSSNIRVSLDGICIYLDNNDITVTGAGYATVLENYLYGMAENPCGFGELLMGEIDFGELIDFDIPLPFVENNYWTLLEAAVNDDTENRSFAQDSMTAAFLMNSAAGYFELPTIIITSQYEDVSAENLFMEDLLPTIYNAFEPQKSVIYPRMFVMDEIYREVIKEYDDGWNRYRLNMDEMIVSRNSFATSQTESINDNADSHRWVGNDIEYFSDSGVDIFLFEPYFGNEIDESLDTIDEYGSGSWSTFAGQPLYDVSDDDAFFAVGSSWNPHEQPIDVAECSPDWRPGQQ